MNLETHNRYFRDIGYNTDKSVTWPPPTSTAVSAGGATGSDIGRAVYMRGHHLVDEYRIEQLVKHCKHVTTVTDLLQHKGTLSPRSTLSKFSVHKMYALLTLRAHHTNAL
jgi:hypothetical protein